MRFFVCCQAITLFALAIPTVGQAGEIDVHINGIRNNDGVVRCGLFTSADGFRKQEREVREVIGKVQGGNATCVFSSIPKGTYAVEVFHAEKNEGKKEIGAFGKPKQGFGFSRNPLNAFGQPSFSEAAVAIDDAPQNLQITLKY